MRPILELSAEKVSRHRSDYSNYFRFKKEKVRASMVFMAAIQSRRASLAEDMRVGTLTPALTSEQREKQ